MSILRAIYRFLLDTIQGILLIIAFLLVLYVFVAKPHEVVGISMTPTLENSEFVLSYLLSVRSDSLRRGDIIVFDSPTEEDRLFIKRIIALSGESIRLYNGKVYINGEMLDEKAYLVDGVQTSGRAFLPEGESKIVPEGYLFVMGDNRDGSSDSRDWGFLDKKAVIGQSIVRILPLNKFMIIKNPFEKK